MKKYVVEYSYYYGEDDPDWRVDCTFLGFDEAETYIYDQVNRTHIAHRITVIYQ